MPTSSDRLIEEIRAMVGEGKEYLEISRYIKSKNLTTEDERWHLNRLDRLLIEHEANRYTKGQLNPFKIVGILVILAGVFMFIYSFNATSGQAVLPYGLMLMGAAMLFMRS